MNTFEQKQADRAARLAAASDRANERSTEAYAKADLREAASGIPLGQPILVGHHSEGRHRRALERADNAMRKSIKEQDHAKELDRRAAAVGTGGISSDDPDAIVKLRAQLADKEANQALMRGANKALRAATRWAGQGGIGDPDWEASIRASLVEPCKKLSPDHWESLIDGLLTVGWGDQLRGFEGFELSNNNANMTRIKQRIAQLERNAKRTTATTQFPNCQVVQNAEQNRLQFLFAFKPNKESRDILKKHGFRWAPSQDAWQRQLTGSANYAARQVFREFGWWQS